MSQANACALKENSLSTASSNSETKDDGRNFKRRKYCAEKGLKIISSRLKIHV